MKLTKNQQIRNLKKLLGSKADLFDLQAHVDGRLTYDENKRIIIDKAKRRGINSKSKLTFKGSPTLLFEKAKAIQKQRSVRSKAIDSVRNARETYNYKLLTVEQFTRWKRNPSQFDILAVDSKGSYVKAIKDKKFKKLTLKQIDSLDIL